MSRAETISGDGTEPEPIFPPEIEREILEQAAQFQGNSVTLALVARRTQIWIERLIYETVTLGTQHLCDQFLRTLDSRPAHFFTDNVKSLCIPADIKPLDAERVLKACQGVVNLAIWLEPQADPLFPFVSSLRPTRLSINHALFGSCEPDFQHPFFSKVTHLELVDWLEWPTSLHHLSAHLTHLAVDYDSHTDGSMARLSDILSSCRSLVVCIALVSNDEIMIIVSHRLASIEDPRLVVLSESDVLENWEASLRGTDASMWSFAEGIVTAKTIDEP
ncbi:hypothetical protein DFH06DRAFT_336448 [Mycena polygramma]|nr:hypothetical protein DFH06DRAFT_336448 [Mycena polygramma]